MEVLGETSEIWMPDIELWKLDVGLKDSFEDTYKTGARDGSKLKYNKSLIFNLAQKDPCGFPKGKVTGSLIF